MDEAQNEKMDSKASSDTDDFPQKGISSALDKESKHQEDYDKLNYPKPWKFEESFIGGYSQGRMIKFKKAPRPLLQASAYNITWMCFARVISGVGVGAIDCVVPVWSAEVSSHSA
ncbi:MAG: hypothetical protein Q9169_003395 [Polycauliona sp. 2 TL-2023]